MGIHQDLSVLNALFMPQISHQRGSILMEIEREFMGKHTHCESVKHAVFIKLLCLVVIVCCAQKIHKITPTQT